MSDLQRQLMEWRDRGSLRYLASELRVSGKQVTRYWDNDWIEGRYRTAKGHRRVRYTGATVEQDRLAVRSVKETNKTIRYYTSTIEHRGRTISAVECNTRADLYREARKPKYGLSEQDACYVGYRHRSSPIGNTEEIAWEMLRRQTGISQAEVDEQQRALSTLPLETLRTAASASEFRARARRAWRAILSEFRAEGRCHSFSTWLRTKRSDKPFHVLRKLLSVPDRRSFVSAFHLATELDHRIMSLAKKPSRTKTSSLSTQDLQTASPADLLERKEEAEQDTDEDTSQAPYQSLTAFAADNPNGARLYTAALQLKHEQQRPSAAALARALRLSRPALYRTFGTKLIREALRGVQNDALSIEESRTKKPPKGKNSRTRAVD
jgi:hypothetical protein